MDAVTLILAVSPVIIVLVCAWLLRLPGDVCGIAGLIAAALVAITYFQTGSDIVGKSIVFGILWGLPVILFIAVSMLQALFMERVQAMRRITAFMKSVTGGDTAAQAIIINIGIAAILAGLGMNPLSIIPLMLIGMGFTPYRAIALPAIGAATLFIYSFFGYPLQEFALHLGGGQTFDQVGAFFVPYLWPATFLLTLGLLYVLGGLRALGRGIPHALITATAVWLVASLTAKFSLLPQFAGLTRFTGIMSGVAVIIVMCIWARIWSGKLIDRDKLTAADRANEQLTRLWKAVMPLVLTAVLIIIAMLVSPIKELLAGVPSITMRIFESEPINIRPLQEPYFWMLAATILCIPLYLPGARGFRESAKQWTGRVPRPVFAIALFCATAFVMKNSGKAEMSIAHYNALVLPEGNLNMIQAMQNWCASVFGTFYPLTGTVAGLRMGFISGSPALPISMLTRIHLEAAEVLFRPGGAGTFIAAASALAGSFMLMVNPAWLMNASAVIGKAGYEGRVVRSTIIIAVVAVISLGVMAAVMARLGQ